MTLEKYIRVNTSYTRSINIERDLQGDGAVASYIPTSRSLQTLERIADTFNKKAAPRAWALIGPYGAGKSAFGLFLSCLLSGRSSNRSQQAQGILDGSDRALGRAYAEHLAGTDGYCVITLTGSPDPLAKRLAKAMYRSASGFFESASARHPKVLKKLKSLYDANEVSVSEVMDSLRELQQSVGAANGRGVLILIDELGKFLEYEARHRQSIDIFLLQSVAEHAFANSDTPVHVVVLLHQAFEQYFTSLGEQLKNEWKKVQGRFEGIPFVESSEQVLRVVKAAIANNLPPAMKQAVAAEVAAMARTLADANALPNGMTEPDARALLEKSYPLHPVSLLLLPTLCQRMAQNERTLFSYLGSAEPHGFQDSLTRLELGKDHVGWVRPWEIYEYFVLNHPGLISDQLTHRRWAEVVTAVERLGDAPLSVVRLLKSIGVLNIAGAQNGLKASQELLSLCFEPDHGDPAATFVAALDELQRKSVITYRRFNNEYRVWQGSDFDLDAALTAQKEQIGKIDLARLLNERGAVAPILARRYSVESGTLRYFAPVFVGGAEQLSSVETEQATIVFCLCENIEAQERYHVALRSVHAANIVVGVVPHAGRLRQAVTEVMAFERVQRVSPDIASDPIAMRELKDRLAQAVDQEADMLLALVEDPADTSWWYGGTETPVRSKRHLQELLSSAVEKTYYNSPKINNELINKDKPSATAIAARNKLLSAMLECSDKADLGFEKFPAEKAMYRSVLLATGIHVRKDGAWTFQPPVPHDKMLGPTWQAIVDYLGLNDTAPKGLPGLFDVLTRPPYGVKTGILPILLVAVLQAYSEEIALFDNGYYCPFLSNEVVERIIKEPHSFSIHRFGIEQIRDRLYRTYVEAVTGEPCGQVNLIAALKPLARFMMALPDYTRNTKTVSAAAQQVRDLFYASKSPVQLLYFQIPEALGFRPLVGKGTNDKMLKELGAALRNVIMELRMAYHGVLHTLETQLKATFSLDSKYGIEQLREQLLRFSGLQEYTIEVLGLKAFIGRLIDPFGDEKQWLISLGSFLGRKPPEKWSDDDAAAVEYRLVDFAKRVRDLEVLRHHTDRHKNKKSSDYDFILLKTISYDKAEKQVFVALDNDKRKAISGVKQKVQELLDSLPDADLGKIVLAVLLDEITPDLTMAQLPAAKPATRNSI